MSAGWCPKVTVFILHLQKVFSLFECSKERGQRHARLHHSDPTLPFICNVHEHQECMTHVDKPHAERLICMEVRWRTRTVFPPKLEVRSGGGTQGTWLSDGEVTLLWMAPHLPHRFPTHRPEGSSRNRGSTGSGHSSSSCEGSIDTSRSPPARRTGRSPVSPGRQTPTLEGCTKKSTRGSPTPLSGHSIHGWVSLCKRGGWEGPGEERTSNQDIGAPDS